MGKALQNLVVSVDFGDLFCACTIENLVGSTIEDPKLSAYGQNPAADASKSSSFYLRRDLSQLALFLGERLTESFLNRVRSLIAATCEATEFEPCEVFINRLGGQSNLSLHLDAPYYQLPNARQLPEFIGVLGHITGVLSSYRRSFATLSIPLTCIPGFGLQFGGSARGGFRSQAERPGLALLFDGDSVIHGVDWYPRSRSSNSRAMDALRFSLVLRFCRPGPDLDGTSSAERPFERRRIERRILQRAGGLLGRTHDSCLDLAMDWNAVSTLVAMCIGRPKFVKR
jgi:hypothetical protein